MAKVRHEDRDRLALWGGILVGPLAWAAVLGISLPLVRQACQSGARGPLIAASLTGLLATGLAGLLVLRRLRPQPLLSDSDRREHFMARLGIALSILFALLIAATALPIFVAEPCPAVPQP